MLRAHLAAFRPCLLLLVPACSGMPAPFEGGDGSASGWNVVELDEGSSGDLDEDDEGIGGSGAGGESSTGEAEAECVRLDVPDFEGIDADGDGVDGTICSTVFVDPTRAVAGSGMAPGDALTSLAEAIEVAASYEPPRDVMVASGAVEESIALRSGVSIYGGYTSDFVRRDLAMPTVLIGKEAHAITGTGLDTGLTVQGFVIVGRDGTDPGTSSYAVALVDSIGALVTFDRCTIIAGDGADGADGADGLAGADGTAGDDGDDGGSGGASACGVAGGAGGAAVSCPAVAAETGSGIEPGAGAPMVLNDCTGTVCTDAPLPGAAGSDGSGGKPGAGAAPSPAFGQLTFEGKWIAPIAASASPGTDGSGGGGGAAASFDLDGPMCGVPHVVNGGIGGGGGAAGCGGGGGEGGGGGGSSIGIVIIDAEVELRSSDLVRGDGGAGGAGGNGGAGGHGGEGGIGRDGAGAGAQSAGEGGRGGDGGNGGGGTGGCAGSSIGIVQRGEATQVHLHISEIVGGNAGTPGMGGLGGSAAGMATTIATDETGAPGCPGIVLDQQYS